MLKFDVKLNMNVACYCLLFAGFSTLMGCGTKGPLYIPEQRYPQGVEQPATPDKSDPNKEKEAPVIPPVVTPPTVKDY